ncbi:hypothetical protein [Rossellomorea aquimaris]|uniref:Uncharacterized protein n=1 Tax=Rossellomorea aquimaris TaxID=189382 RepID=A0A1J6WEV2_9BACI|nr:hypothetical protein [Rossellomorea aquimaris]OIU70408.1 hypothetical protein BHE18_11865 [Rossellomorea aquimaris]
MNRYKRGFILLIMSTLLLAGCRIEWDATPAVKTKQNTGKLVKLDGKVNLKSTELIIEGTTNLPKNSIIYASIKEYGDLSSKYGAIIHWQAEASAEITAEGTGKVDKDGNYTITVPRKDPSKRYLMEVLFNPALQPLNIQEIYGLNGENMKLITGMTKVDDVTVVSRVVPIVSITDPNGNDIAWGLCETMFQTKPKPIK